MALLLLAGLVTIDSQLYEAAKVDGASAWQRFTRITLPLMKPAILVALLFRTLDAFRVFDTIFIMTRGAQDTESVSILGFNQLISRLNLGPRLGGLGADLPLRAGDRVPLRAGLRRAGRGREAGKLRWNEEAASTPSGASASSLVLIFALIPVLWLISLSLKPTDAVTDGRFLPSRDLLRQLQEPVRRRASTTAPSSSR